MADEKRTRRRNCSGSLRLRGRTYWARWQYKGKTFERSTGITIATDRCVEKAVKKMEEFTAPYRLMNEHDLQEFMTLRLKSLGQAVVEANVRGGELTISEAYAAFEKSPRRRTIGKAALGQYEMILRDLGSFAGAETLMNRVSRTVAEAYAEKTAARLSNLTFNNYIAKLGHVWDVLGPNNHMQVNPWRGIVYKEDDSISREPLTKEEIEKVKALTGDELGPEKRLLVIIGENTGMRIGDCATLKWQDIDLDNGFIRVKTEKTGAKVSIPLLSELRGALDEIPPKRRKEVYVLKELSRNGDVSQLMADHFRNAGIETNVKVKEGSPARPVKTFHSLRSNFVTMCAEAGISLEIVQAITGHTTRKMTEHYMHIREAAIKAAFDKAGIK